MPDLSYKIQSLGVCVSSDRQSNILHDITLTIPKNKVIALIGPSGCGKTTFLQCLNKMLDPQVFKIRGTIFLDDQNTNDLSVAEIRTRVGTIFQTPNPFPCSVYENVAYGPKLHNRYSNLPELDMIVRGRLQQVGLWSEIAGCFHQRSGFDLSVGQQQRLCIARALAVNPEVLLMDEPCSALDPKSTQAIETLIRALSASMTIVVVTDNMEQVLAISDLTVVFANGEIIEENETATLFKSPRHPLTREYLH